MGVLCNVSIQEPFQETKIWDRVCLRNIQNFKISMRYLTFDLGANNWMSFSSISTQELFNKSMGQCLFKKDSKFQNFDEILYCGMTRFRNVTLGAFRQY